MPTKVVSIVNGAKEEILKALLRAIEYVNDSDDDMPNWGAFVVLVDDQDHPWMVEEANMTSSLTISSCHLLALKEAVALLETPDESA